MNTRFQSQRHVVGSRQKNQEITRNRRGKVISADNFCSAAEIETNPSINVSKPTQITTIERSPTLDTVRESVNCQQHRSPYNNYAARCTSKPLSPVLQDII